ncbi:MAG: hypothetical protein J7K15_02720 [Deltaproteobacteria bacterium]|nr:hypothetical protein [Deltaproteobacteria bacterium]
MQDDLKEILEACSISTQMVAKTFFPERFNMPFAESVYGNIFDLIGRNHGKAN